VPAKNFSEKEANLREEIRQGMHLNNLKIAQLVVKDKFQLRPKIF
jgi:hypothetical protein